MGKGWHFRNEPDFIADQRLWLQKPSWIIEGVGGWTGLLERFRQADLIAHMNTPIALCQERAEQRIIEDRVTKNRFMADGCRYGDVVELQSEVIRHFESKVRGDIERILTTNFARKPQLHLDGTQSSEALCRELFARALSA